MPILATNLGFPRLGRNRELKKLVESHWAGKATEQDVLNGAKAIRASHWKVQRDAGLHHIPSGDFSLYDQVLDTAFMLGAIPGRYHNLAPGLETYFAMARGLQRAASADKPAVDVQAMEMKKWFNTNYHFVVPELDQHQAFKLASPKPLEEYHEAKAQGIETRPVVLGPVSFLLLSKPVKGQSFDLLSLLDSLLPVYSQLFASLAKAGASWIQVDEPILVTDWAQADVARISAAFTRAYAALSACGARLLLATYFESVADKLDLLRTLPVSALHIDLTRAPAQLHDVLKAVSAKSDMCLSLGVVDGRNVWRADLQKALTACGEAVRALGADRVMVAPSCSLLHSPFSLQDEKKMDPEIKQWLAFAVEKLHEVSTIVRALTNPEDEAVKAELAECARALEARAKSPRTRRESVRAAMASVKPEQLKRHAPFPERWKQQQAKLHLPKFPTTSIGSLPQTTEVRTARAKFKRGDWSEQQYESFVHTQIEQCVRKQEEIGIDVLVHGEFERNDMVEFFGEHLDGFVFTENGWVQSYGSRGVKPAIIYGDVARPRAMTVDVIKYAQSLTKKPMKGMLTGPITCLQWSFVRNDQHVKDTAQQLALAIREEVADLEKAGIPIIQIDEPALREGLPIRHADQPYYLQWSVDCFLLASCCVRNDTQIHTHFCYSDFNEIVGAMARMDADVTTVESSKSDLKLLRTFDSKVFPNSIGPGVYDVHSPRVPTVQEMKERIQAMLYFLPADLLWVNPDCGLKTRGWPEVIGSLKNMVQVAKELRA